MEWKGPTPERRKKAGGFLTPWEPWYSLSQEQAPNVPWEKTGSKLCCISKTFSFESLSGKEFGFKRTEHACNPSGCLTPALKGKSSGLNRKSLLTNPLLIRIIVLKSFFTLLQKVLLHCMLCILKVLVWSYFFIFFGQLHRLRKTFLWITRLAPYPQLQNRVLYAPSPASKNIQTLQAVGPQADLALSPCTSYSS